MKRFFADMNPLVRGLLIVAAIAGVVFVFQLEQTLTALFVLVRIAFILAIAVFVYLVWRERRSEIALWPARAQWTFYGAALLLVAAVGLRWAGRVNALAFVVTLVVCGFAMWRVWRDAHTYT